MNLLKKGMLFLFAVTLFVACSDDDEVVTPVTPEEPVSAHPLAGTSWSISAEVGALVVAETRAQAEGDMSGATAGGNENPHGAWWYFSQWGDDAAARACLLDDTYEFNADNTFVQTMGAETWTESWQPGQDGEGCTAPIAPHDGSVAATWSADTSTITIVGDSAGAFLGLAKVTNTAEDGNPAGGTTTYDYVLSEDGNHLTLVIQGFQGNDSDATWVFRMTKN